MIGTGILFPNTSSAIILIKDAEIENSLQIIANPIYKAAKIDHNSIKIILIQRLIMFLSLIIKIYFSLLVYY